MNTERNLLFGLLARQAGLIDGPKLIEACRIWSARREAPLADLLVDRQWITPAERAVIRDRVDDALRKHRGDAQAALSAMLDDPKQLLAAVDDPEIRRAVFGAPDADMVKTVLSGDKARTVTSAETAKTVLAADAAGATATTDGTLRGPLPYVLMETLSAGPRYTRTSLHASGGMGNVWLARDAHIGRDVALKELLPAGAASSTIPIRFLREARITAQLEHPGVVPVYELGRDAETGRPYYTMRFVRGRTLSQASTDFHSRRQAGNEDPLDLVTLLSAFVSVCNTIAFAHSHGVVHRDLKGENIILGDFGEVLVLDWGLAKQLDDCEADQLAGSEDFETELPLTAGQTVMGQVMGTPAYMAPEQAQGRLDLVGPRTDIFGSGAILYEILTGRPPFAGNNTIDVLQQAVRAEIVPPRTFWPDVPHDLEAACLKAMAREQSDRHATAAELAREIQGWQDKQRRKAENELRKAGERLMHQQAALVALTRSEVFMSADLTDIYRQMIEVSARTLGVARVSVWRYTDDRRAIHCHLLYELKEDRCTSGIELKADDFPSYFEALKTSEVIAAHDACEDPRTREFTKSYLKPLDIGAIMDAPIHLSGTMGGVVCHEHVGSPRKWSPDEQLFAIAIANLVSQAISQSEHREET